MKILAHDIFDEVTAYTKLLDDLSKCRGRVVFYVPYASLRRLKIIQDPIVACVQRTVKVCCYLQRPRNWEATPQTQEVSNLKAAISELERLGAHVTTRSGLHEKLVIIDENIFYDGSLNVLSHFDTSERMTRYVSPQLVRDAYNRYQLDDCAVCFGSKVATPFISLLGQELKAARKRQGLTQSQFAKLCSMHQSDISEIESGARNPSIETVNVLLDVLQLRAVVVPQHLLPAVNQVIEVKSPESRPSPKPDRVTLDRADICAPS